MTAAAFVTFFHVAAGTLVLFVAPAAMIARKGGRWHRTWGIAFSSAMALVLFTAAFMWQSHGHLFLLYLDVVCGYLVFQGYRTIARRRRSVPDARADRIDAIAAAFVVACAVVLVVLGATANTPLMHSISTVLFSLAAVATVFAFLDLKAILERRQTRLGSLLVHLSAMIGAYISAVTAFCVINFHGVPMGLRWLVPSLVGSFVIAGFSIVYRRRFATRRSAGSTSLIPTR